MILPGELQEKLLNYVWCVIEIIFMHR